MKIGHVKPGDVKPGHMKPGQIRLCIWPVYELREGACRVHLTPHEGLIMTTLLGHREATVELLMEVLWPDPDLMPDRWYEILVVQLSKLRSKLRRCGWTIAVRHGFGWRLQQLREERLAA